MSAKPGQRPPRGTPWTPAEDRYMRHDYRALGGPEVQRRLANRGYPRSIHAIHRRAQRLRLQHEFADNAGLFPLTQAHSRDRNGISAGAHKDIVEAARADGVLERGRTRPYAYLAPAWWVGEYMARLDREMYEELTLTRTWLTTTDVAKIFGLARGSLAAIISPSYRKRFALVDQCKRIPKRHLKHKIGDFAPGTILWEPTAVQREARVYQARKARRRLGNGFQRLGGRP